MCLILKMDGVRFQERWLLLSGKFLNVIQQFSLSLASFSCILSFHKASILATVNIDLHKSVRAFVARFVNHLVDVLFEEIERF